MADSAKNKKKEVLPEEGVTRLGLRAEVAALLAVAVAVLSAFFLWAPSGISGVLGQITCQIIYGLFGTLAAIIPLLLFYMAAEFYLEKEQSVSHSRRLCMFFFFLSVITLISILSLDFDKVYAASATDQRHSAWSAVQVLWNSGMDPTLVAESSFWNGGLIGGLFALGLVRVTGYTGSLIIVIFMMLALSCLVFDLSWKQTIRKTAHAVTTTSQIVGQKGRDMLARSRERMEEHARREAEYPMTPLADDFGQVSPASGSSLPPLDLSHILKDRDDPEDDMPQKEEPSKAPEDDIPIEEQPPKPSVSYSFPEGSWYRKEGESETSDRTLQIPVLNSGSVPEAASAAADTREDTPQIRSVNLPIKDDYLLHAIVEKPVMPANDDTHSKSDTSSRKPASDSDAENNTEDKSLHEIAKDITEDTAALQSDNERDHWKDRSEGAKEKGQMSLFSNYMPPPTSLLNEDRQKGRTEADKEEIRLLGAKLEKTLNDFGVDAKVVNFITGPTISRFELTPGPGVKVSKIVNLADDIALALAAVGVRIEAPIPGKSAIGIEIPNKKTKPVLLRGLIESEAFKEADGPLTAAIGRDIQGGEMLCDLSKMPHLLIAGATGSGKSVCINSILISLLYRSSPRDLRLLMIDPKVVELSVYNGIPHLKQPVVTDPKKAYAVLDWAVQEMTRRYGLFADNSVRDFRAYNDLVKNHQIEKGEHLPLILIVIDELSDLMATTPTEVENAISRLTAMARAAGIHLIIATQRPSVDVITGVIKANIPSRIAFAVASQVDSRTILDMAGAEKLLGKGDMLYYPQSSSKPLRGQGAFVTDSEVERVIQYLKNLYPVQYDEELARALETASAGDGGKGAKSDESEEDELLMEALRTVIETGYASVSLLQRRLTIGYPRAARLIDSLHDKGWVGPFEGSKPRKVLITASEYEALTESEDS